MGSAAPAPRLRGREVEQRLLEDALDRVASGGPATVLIEGEAGIGKTHLLEQVLQDARARGMQAAAGRADELERARPFGLLAGAFDCVPSSSDPRRAAIAALLAARGGSDEGPITVTSDPGLQFRAVDAFGDLAEVLALPGPLVIGADDLHWADPSSLLTLAAMGRRLSDLPVAIIRCFGVFLGFERFIAGEWDDAITELESSLELAGEIGETYSAAHAHIVIRLGDHDASFVHRAAAVQPGPGD